VPIRVTYPLAQAAAAQAALTQPRQPGKILVV
jgi:NADPH:quinone reductase-like Zn-dependent oxidoreductase